MPTPQQAQWLAKLGVKGAAGAPPTRGGPTGGQAAAASAPPPAQIPVPQVAGDSKDAAVKALSPLDTIKASPTQKGMFTIVLNGQPTPVSEAQVSEARAKTRDAMKRNLVAVKIKAEGAMTRYSEQKKVDADQWAVSAAVTALKKVTSLGKFADPGPNLTKEVDAARAALAAASSALDGNAFAKAAAAFADAEAAAAKAEQMAIAYCEGMIDGAGSSITVLERTRDVSAITVSVLATIATAGAASGAIGSTTTVAGVQVGTVAAANVVATGASIAGSVGMAASQMALGNKVDWGAVAIDAAIQLLLAKFGGAASKGISASVAKQLATRMAAKRIVELGIEKLVQGIILQEASVTLHTVAESVYAELRGKDLTWGQFFKTLLERLTDPRGLAVAAVVAALTTGAEAKYGGGLVTAGGGKDGAGGKPPPAAAATAAPAAAASRPRTSSSPISPTPKSAAPSTPRSTATCSASSRSSTSPTRRLSGRSTMRRPAPRWSCPARIPRIRTAVSSASRSERTNWRPSRITTTRPCAASKACRRATISRCGVIRPTPRRPPAATRTTIRRRR